MAFHLNVDRTYQRPRARPRKKLGVPYVELGLSLVGLASIAWMLHRSAPVFW